jgi:hypothetical protein
MRVLVACEESQAVTIAFRDRGHEAFSCDLQECSGGYPEWHIKGDLTDYVQGLDWNMVISFPPCTDLSVSGARWFDKKRLNGSQEKAIEFFLFCWSMSNCVENPIGIMNNGQYIKKWFPALYIYATNIGFGFKPTQIVHPWQFGHGETKATCLWLNGLPRLAPTDIVEGRDQRIWKMPPSANRGKDRSKTYEGIARAMASQWG